MVINRFEDIKAWQLARELTKSLYLISYKKNFCKDYCLKDQLHRASVSIMLNIAEGFDSGSNQSFINFLKYSIRSTSEVKSVMYIAMDLNYISQSEFDEVLIKLDTIKNLLAGLIRYLSSTDLKSNLGARKK